MTSSELTIHRLLIAAVAAIVAGCTPMTQLTSPVTVTVEFSCGDAEECRDDVTFELEGRDAERLVGSLGRLTTDDVADPSIGCGGEFVDGPAERAVVTYEVVEPPDTRASLGKVFCMTDQRDDPVVQLLYERAGTS